MQMGKYYLDIFNRGIIEGWMNVWMSVFVQNFMLVCMGKYFLYIFNQKGIIELGMGRVNV